MKPVKIITFLVLMIFSPARAQQVAPSVQNSAGGISQFENWSLLSSMGQPAPVGKTTHDSLEIASGFLNTLFAPPSLTHSPPDSGDQNHEISINVGYAIFNGDPTFDALIINPDLSTSTSPLPKSPAEQLNWAIQIIARCQKARDADNYAGVALDARNRTFATVGGGKDNTSSGRASTVGGGVFNTASGTAATVPGGELNEATGAYSFAAGRQAKALHDGTFVWGDVTGGNFASTGTNQFLVRASGGVGIGTNAPQTQLHVQRAISASGTPQNHVALIENTAPDNGFGPDVLALKTGAINPGGATNMISFFDGNNTAIGRIEGNGNNGVFYGTSGGDYAESLPRLNPSERIEKGDIVGVFDGKVSKKTTGAQYLMVVSSRPAVVGNLPPEDQEEDYEKVAFLGQVAVKVRGPVRAGDFILPSGLEDGTGIAITPRDLKIEQYPQVIGQAWESSSDTGIKKINVLVGLPFYSRIASEISSLKQENQSIKQELQILKKQVSQLQSLLKTFDTLYSLNKTEQEN